MFLWFDSGGRERIVPDGRVERGKINELYEESRDDESEKGGARRSF